MTHTQSHIQICLTDNVQTDQRTKHLLRLISDSEAVKLANVICLQTHMWVIITYWVPLSTSNQQRVQVYQQLVCPNKGLSKCSQLIDCHVDPNILAPEFARSGLPLVNCSSRRLSVCTCCLSHRTSARLWKRCTRKLMTGTKMNLAVVSFLFFRFSEFYQTEKEAFHIVWDWCVWACCVEEVMLQLH